MPKFNKLKQARKEKGLSLKRISEEIKISAAKLAALEEGDFNCFPGRFYAKIFLKTYAKYLGVNVDLSQLNGLDEKHRIVLMPEDKPSPLREGLGKIMGKENTKSTKKVLSNVIGILVIIGLLSFGLFYLMEKKTNPSILNVGDLENPAVQIPEKIMIKGITEEPVWMRIVADDILKEERILTADATYYWQAYKSLKMKIGYVDGIKIYYKRSETDFFREVDIISGNRGKVNELEFSK